MENIIEISTICVYYKLHSKEEKQMARMTSYPSQMEAIVDQREDLLEKASGVLANAMLTMVKEGASSTRSIENDVRNLIKGFNEEEKIELLTKAVAKFIVNS